MYCLSKFLHESSNYLSTGGIFECHKRAPYKISKEMVFHAFSRKSRVQVSIILRCLLLIFPCVSERNKMSGGAESVSEKHREVGFTEKCLFNGTIKNNINNINKIGMN